MSDLKATQAKPDAEPKLAPAQTKPSHAEPAQPVYPVAEFVANARGLYGISRDLAAAAFRCAGKAGCTSTEAKDIIEKFRKRKVN